MEEKKVLCPACGAELELKLERFSIGADGGGGILAAMFCDQYEVDLYACPRCGKVELYTAGFQRERQGEAEAGDEVPVPAEAEPAEEVVCPVCGTRHSSAIGCPACVLYSVQSGQAYQSPKKAPPKPPRSRSGRKPPWEK